MRDEYGYNCFAVIYTPKTLIILVMELFLITRAWEVFECVLIYKYMWYYD